jgi:flagellin
LTQSSARNALTTLDQTLARITKQAGSIGAFQERLTTASSAVASQQINYEQAKSRIMDADIAQESSTLTRLQILQQAASAVLSQANLSPQIALSLLRG